MARPRSGGNAFYITAYDCPARLRGGADDHCTGTNDHLKINAGIAALYTSDRPILYNSGEGGTILLSPGTYRIGGSIQPRGNLSIVGANVYGSRILNAASNPIVMMDWRMPHVIDDPTFVSYTSGSKTYVVSGIDVEADDLEGKYLRVKRGLMAGEKRLIASNTATSGGNTSIVLSDNFSSDLDATSKVCVDATPGEASLTLQTLFLDGNRYADGSSSGVKTILSTSVGAQTDALWVDDGANMRYNDTPGTAVGAGGFPSWVVGLPLYVYVGTGIGQVRYIEGRSQSTPPSGPYDTLLLDGPWWPALDGTSKCCIGGVGLWKAGLTMDVIWNLCYMEKMAGWGVISEFPWGDAYLGGYIEYCDLGGVYCSQPPLYYAVTGTWDRSTTTGQLATSGPKIVGVKIVGHGPIITGGVVVGGDAVKVYGRVLDSKIGLSEFGSDVYKHDGLSLSGGYGGSEAYGTIVGNTFSSWDNNGGSIENNAIRLGENALENAIVGNTIRQDATTGPYRGFDALAGSGQNVIADNVLSSPTGTLAQRDAVGWNQYTNNLNVEAKEQWRFLGKVSAAANASGEVTLTFPAPLVTVPSGADLIGTFSPVDATTGGVAGWYVSALSKTAITIKSASAVETTVYTFNVRVEIECRQNGNA